MSAGGESIDSPMPSVTLFSCPVTGGPGQLDDNLNEIVETTAPNFPKLKELNYSRWRSAFSNAVKRAGLWEYIDGSILLPLISNPDEYKKHFLKSSVVLDALAKGLEIGALKYIEDSLTAREAWVALEQKYQSANDSFLASVEQQLADLKLSEDGDVIEHVTTFRCLCRFLAGTRFALDNQASSYKLYRSLPANYRQWVMTQGLIETEDFELLCSSLKARYLDTYGRADTLDPATVDYSSWGVPDDVKAVEITGQKNPLLEERAKVTCRDCLLKDHVAGTPECPQFEWRRELWGQPERSGERASVNATTGPVDIDSASIASSIPLDNDKATQTELYDGRLVYEFSEPVKVVSEFSELGLNKDLLQNMQKRGFKKPSEFQKCVILPIISGRDVIARAEPKSGKSAAIAISVLQSIDANIQETQVIVLSPTPKSVVSVQAAIVELLSGSPQPAPSIGDAVAGAHLRQIPHNGNQHVVSDTPDRILDMMQRRIIDLRHVKLLVLDSADKLADNGFTNQILDIHRLLIRSPQVVVLSNASSMAAAKLSTRLTGDPVYINVRCNELVPAGIQQFFMAEKAAPEIMAELYRVWGVSQAVVFCNTQSEIDWLCDDDGHPWGNSESGYFRRSFNVNGPTRYLHIINKGTAPDQRNGAAHHVSNNNYSTLVTTETWPAGCSTQRISLVFNYGVPSDRETYLNRIGDFGKFGKKCLVINLVTRDEISIIRGLEHSCGFEIPELKLSDLGKDNRPLY